MVRRTLFLVASVSLVQNVPAGTEDLADYLLASSNKKTWFMSLQAGPTAGSSSGPAIRYVTHVETRSSQTWFRWQFSAALNEAYNVFYFSEPGDDKLRYSEVRSNCDSSGRDCEWRTSYPDSLVYAPRYLTGSAQSGNGASRVQRYWKGSSAATCSGINRYSWEVIPYGNELALFPRINTKLSTPIHFRSTQSVTITRTSDNVRCPAGTTPHVVDFWFGTGCNAPDFTDCTKTVVHTKGGSSPFLDDTRHWNLTFQGAVAAEADRAPARSDGAMQGRP